MNYRYVEKSYEELERIAEFVLAKFPNRRVGLAVDIEGILEDLGLDLFPRRGIRHIVEAYLPRDPRIIVIDESILSYMPRARFTIAEEVCHLILEYELWKGGEIPQGAEGHALSKDQHYYVERDAKGLASALLMPREDFRVAFRNKWRDLEKVTRQNTILAKSTLTHLMDSFDVSKQAAFYRARNLKLIDEKGLPF